MKAELSPIRALQSKDPEKLSPIIERLSLTHNKNQLKQKRAQIANHDIVVQYEKFKKNYQEKIKSKDMQIIKKLGESRKIKVQFYKKQSIHVEKIIEKFRKEDRKRQLNKLDIINKRNHSTHNHQSSGQRAQTCGDSQAMHKTQPKLGHSSINIEQFYKNRYQRMSEMCESIRKKSFQKQERAESNRKSIQQQSTIKQRNQLKKKKKKHLQKQLQQNQKNLIRKSIQKLQRWQKRWQQNSASSIKKLKVVHQSSKKNMQEVRRRRCELQQKISQRLQSIQKKSVQKKQRFVINKQNRMATKIQNKKNKRLQKIDSTMKNYYQNRNQYNEKMSDLYKRDKEQWGFLTGINQFKNILIQRNVYENNSLSLNK